MLVLSIDPGTETGWALRDVLAQQYREVRTVTITRALFDLRDRCARGEAPGLVMFEDARRMFRRRDRTSDKRRTGYGSIRRDCAIWEEALEELGIPYVASAPAAGLTKLSAETFVAVTGWTERTSNHARDAAMRVLNINTAMARAMAEGWRSNYLLKSQAKPRRPRKAPAKPRPSRLQDAARGRW